MSRRVDAEQCESVLAVLRSCEHELLELARELVATPSPNPPGDERAVADLVRQAMVSFGYSDVRMVAKAEERPNVIGEVGRPQGRSLILTGHLDTKPAGSEAAWRVAPYEPALLDGRLHGLGSADMKGGVAAMIFAGRALAEVADLGGRVKVVLTADEEAGGGFGARFVAGHAVAADAVLVGEPTGLVSPWEYISVVSRGTSCFRIRVRGTQLHSSLTDRLPAVNASVKMAGVLARLAEEFRPSYDPGSALGATPTVNAGVLVRGGVFYGICPGEAEFGIDVRTVPGMTLDRLHADLEEFLGSLRREDPELDVEVEVVEAIAWFPPAAIARDHPLVGAVRAAAADVLGRDVPRGVFPGATDGGLWAEAGMACVPAFGPGLLTLAHRPNEHVAVEELFQASRIFALAALRFVGGERASPPAAPERSPAGRP